MQDRCLHMVQLGQRFVRLVQCVSQSPAAKRGVFYFRGREFRGWRSCRSRVFGRGPRAGLEQIAHNQVLVSATAACLIGQLSKPLASALLGKGFNWRLALKSSGMPSTHSASIVASATAIGLERGLSDSLFGLTVVVAGIVMYDAQVLNHGIYGSLMERMKRVTREFILLPLQEKVEYAVQEHEGYGQAFVFSEDQQLDWSDLGLLKDEIFSADAIL